MIPGGDDSNTQKRDSLHQMFDSIKIRTLRNILYNCTTDSTRCPLRYAVRHLCNIDDSVEARAVQLHVTFNLFHCSAQSCGTRRRLRFLSPLAGTPVPFRAHVALISPEPS